MCSFHENKQIDQGQLTPPGTTRQIVNRFPGSHTLLRNTEAHVWNSPPMSHPTPLRNSAQYHEDMRTTCVGLLEAITHHT